MASNLFRAFGLVSAIAIIPAATAAFASAEADSMREFDEFMSVFNRVRADYVEKVDDKTLLRGAIDGMLASLDPHSSYLDQKGYQSLMTTTEGEYGGLGLNVTLEDGVVKIVAPIEDSPGFKAGLKAGDYITHLNGKLIYGGALDEAVDQMRGAPGTTIKITILRPGRDKPFDVTLTRAKIELPAVKWEVKDRVGIINVNTFSRTTTTETLAAIAAIDKSLGGPPTGYIVDLRSNPGGLLDQAVGLSDVFLERGEVVSQRGRQKNDIERYYAEPGDATRGRPIVVLVDSGSASAAEIVAAALQDHHRAIVMGERSFGKGSVQTLLPLSKDTALRLTTARYYTPSGRSVQEGGIVPDIEVPQLSDPDYKSRPRLREADLRRHLINEVKVDESVVQDDGKPDPRFSATPEELKKKGIDDFQLHYAVQTIARLAGPRTATASAAGAAPKGGTR
ncbi:S41 family peptidase [Sphingosinicella sp. BN140058]|uniref:S41 family peptidase n=1 Tax=Sphingosinicella sp. BN140058 TaxID=1892855 RepID=UPI0010115983|nr:S41 family peptidase [Sphingosinicella sp. BN140058]QAY75657.1 S41 family peptidase [Sphingosinicella sp. BN140058]